MTGYVLSKFDTDDNNNLVPLVASISVAWHGTMMPDTPDGFALVYVNCDPAHYAFIASDPDILWVGNEWDIPIPQLLTTYAARLDATVTYANVGQVLSKLGQWSTRFIEKP